jgi:flagellar hook assembly protein FlgD
MTMPLVGYSSGIQNTTATSTFLLYPNPTSAFINIDLPDQKLHYTINIYNAIGELVYTKAINTQNNLPIAIAHLGAGVYEVRLSDGVKVLTQNFVKQ